MTRRSMSTTRRTKIFQQAGGLCHICGSRIDGTRERWEVEHPIPIAMGGSDDDADLRPAHVSCHARKTKADATAIAKAKRIASKHSGAHRPRSTFATARSGGWRKPINGNAVRRNDA